MKKSLQPMDGDTEERNEHARKIFRYISEVARRLDEANGTCKTISDLFKTSVEINRQKLRDNCEKLMFADPILYGHKAQEILWRKGYYEVVTTAKNFQSEDHLCNLLLAHIEAGIGHYQQIIYKMQMEFNIDMKGYVDYPILDVETRSNHLKGNTADVDLCTRAKKAIQNCLIYIGDLCRYKAELEDQWDPSYSARYYLQAACVDRNIGTPYNQLGTLYIEKNCNLDSVCYYIHCLSCLVPFEGVEDNLVGLLDKNNKKLETLSSNYADSYSPHEKIKLFICRFLSLLDYWYFQKDTQMLGKLSNVTLIAFKDCLQLKTNILNNGISEQCSMLDKVNYENMTHPQYISSNIVLNVTSICILCLNKLKDSDEKSLFPIKAFTLAFFSQLLEKLLVDLESIGFIVPILNRSNGFIKKKTFPPLNRISTKEYNHKHCNENLKGSKHTEASSTTCNNSHEGNMQRKSSKLRLRRRKHRKSDSVVDSGDETCSDLSELEINDSGDDISLEGESSTDEYCSDADGCLKTTDGIDKIKNSQNSDENCNVKVEKIEVVDDSVDKKINGLKVEIDENKLSCFLSDNILPSMRLLQAFLESESDLMKTCGKSGHTLFKTLVDVLNILNVNFLGRHSVSVEKQSHPLLNEFLLEAEEIKEFYDKIPLPEDLKMKGINLLKLHQDSLKWDLLEQFKVTALQENAVRILKFIDFGHLITTLVHGVCYNKSQQFFFVKYKFLPKKLTQKMNPKKLQEKKDLKRQNQKLQTKVGVHTLTIHNRIHHSTAHGKSNSDTSQMRILGKLWLMNQVRELETQVKSGKKSHNFPPYIVIDTEALCLHMKIVKQLVGARKFIVLIPTVVLQAIDELKKESSGARDAIRWLEAQLRSGSRFLRAQRPLEVVPLTWIKYPKKMTREMQNFVQIIEFCNHFIMNNGSAPKTVSSWNANGDSEIANNETKTTEDEFKVKAEDKIKEENGDYQSAHIIVFLTGSKQYLNASEQNKDFSFTGLAQTAGVRMEYIQDFSLKWRHIFYKGPKKR